MPCTSWGLTTLLVLLAKAAAGEPVPPLSAAAVTPAPTAAPTRAATTATDTHRGPRLPASEGGAGGAGGGGSAAGGESSGGTGGARRSSSAGSQADGQVVTL